jgi:hypothetical protein
VTPWLPRSPEEAQEAVRFVELVTAIDLETGEEVPPCALDPDEVGEAVFAVSLEDASRAAREGGLVYIGSDGDFDYYVAPPRGRRRGQQSAY